MLFYLQLIWNSHRCNFWVHSVLNVSLKNPQTFEVCRRPTGLTDFKDPRSWFLRQRSEIQTQLLSLVRLRWFRAACPEGALVQFPAGRWIWKQSVIIVLQRASDVRRRSSTSSSLGRVLSSERPLLEMKQLWRETSRQTSSWTDSGEVFTLSRSELVEVNHSEQQTFVSYIKLKMFFTMILLSLWANELLQRIKADVLYLDKISENSHVTNFKEIIKRRFFF